MVLKEILNKIKMILVKQLCMLLEFIDLENISIFEDLRGTFFGEPIL